MLRGRSRCPSSLTPHRRTARRHRPPRRHPRCTYSDGAYTVHTAVHISVHITPTPIRSPIPIQSLSSIIYESNVYRKNIQRPPSVSGFVSVPCSLYSGAVHMGSGKSQTSILLPIGRSIIVLLMRAGLAPWRAAVQTRVRSIESLSDTVQN